MSNASGLPRLVTPGASGIAGAAVVAELLPWLVQAKLMPRAEAERILGEARRRIGKHSTQSHYGEAISFLSGLQEDLPQV